MTVRRATLALTPNAVVEYAESCFPNRSNKPGNPAEVGNGFVDPLDERVLHRIALERPTGGSLHHHVQDDIVGDGEGHFGWAPREPPRAPRRPGAGRGCGNSRRRTGLPPSCGRGYAIGGRMCRRHRAPRDLPLARLGLRDQRQLGQLLGRLGSDAQDAGSRGAAERVAVRDEPQLQRRATLDQRRFGDGRRDVQGRDRTERAYGMQGGVCRGTTAGCAPPAELHPCSVV